eukprot:scaffold117_cov345-Pavlova_lutheri.AAC.4
MIGTIGATDGPIGACDGSNNSLGGTAQFPCVRGGQIGFRSRSFGLLPTVLEGFETLERTVVRRRQSLGRGGANGWERRARLSKPFLALFRSPPPRNLCERFVEARRLSTGARVVARRRHCRQPPPQERRGDVGRRRCRQVPRSLPFSSPFSRHSRAEDSLNGVALARPPPFPVARRRRGWWSRCAFALVRAFVGVAAAAETVGRNVEERCSCVLVPLRRN